MKLGNKIALGVLVALLVATVFGLIRTGGDSSIPAGNGPLASAAPEQTAAVDQAPLLTAQALARMPTGAAELPLAQGALQLGDQEMDSAFALALLDATQHPPALTAEAKRIQTRLQKAEDDLAAEQTQITQLTAAEAKASGARKDALDDQLDLAKAGMELRQDEVDDARQDLIRAGGDPQDLIEAMVQEHDKASQASDSTKVAVSAAAEPHGFIQEAQQWSAQHRKQLLLWRAKQQALATAAALAARHNSLSRQADEQSGQPAAALPGSSVASAPGGSADSKGPAREESAAMLKAMKLRAAGRKTLFTLDKRVHNENQLAGLYGQWIGVVAAEQRSVINGGLRGVLLILAIAIVAFFLDEWIVSLLRKLSLDRRQVETLRTVAGVTLEILGLLLVLLVIFGPPSQLGTVLGLAGAGLTVALQGFIVAFFGRFVLMGKNGIRIGDWVEINGVTGEVTEIGMFHTVLLETGNWTESSHPTGRNVTFTNSYAIEGHYFNFSTSGQWLWDELKFVLTAGHNLRPVVDAIHQKVLEATSESVRQAEQEWHKAAKSRDATALSAEPAISVKPVIGGTEICVRYITRAKERSQLRAELNHALVDLLGRELAPQPALATNR